MQEFARNVGTLRKSKEDVAVDMSERKAAASAMQGAFNPELDEVEEEMLDASVQTNGAVDDTLRLSYHLIKGRWTKEDRETAADFAPLHQPWKDPPTLSIENFTPMVTDSTSGVRRDVSAETLKLWAGLIKGVELSSTTGDAHTITSVAQDINSTDGNDSDEDCDSDADDEYAALEPVLTFTESTADQPYVAELAARWRQHPSPSSMANLIAEVVPLNAKQKRTVSMIFHHVMQHQGRPAVENNDQLLQYVGGRGTGKS